MNKYIEHFKTITKHKWYVFKECKACGILWQGIIHDLSKYTPTEFISSAKYFQGNRSPIEAEKEDLGYSLAWQHHKGHNKHHWEYWTDFDNNGEVIANRIPYKYVIEMICDWVAAGKVYESNNWDQSVPIKYYEKTRNARHYNVDTEIEIVNLLNIIKYNGLDKFHEIVKKEG